LDGLEFFINKKSKEKGRKGGIGIGFSCSVQKGGKFVSVLLASEEFAGRERGWMDDEKGRASGEEELRKGKSRMERGAFVPDKFILA